MSPMDENVSDSMKGLVSLEEDPADARDIERQVVERPATRVDVGEHVDVDDPAPGVVAEAGIHLTRNVNVERNNRRVQIGRKMERAFVEMSDLTGGDSSALRAQVHGLASVSKDAFRALEDARALRRPVLRNGEECPEHPRDHAERNVFAQKSAQEEPAVGEAERDENEEVER